MKDTASPEDPAPPAAEDPTILQDPQDDQDPAPPAADPVPMAPVATLAPLALDPLPEALDLDHLGDLEGWLDLLLPEAQDLEQQDLSSSMAVAGRGPSAGQGQCLPWGCHLRVGQICDLTWLGERWNPVIRN